MALTGETERLPFFLYGSLRTGESNWQIYLAGRTTQEIPACLHGYRMFGATYPYIIKAEPDQIIQGHLMYVDPVCYDDVLIGVDYLEGYDPSTNDGLWLRAVCQAEYTDAQRGQLCQARAWVYLGNVPLLHSTQDFQPIESGDWLNR